jgi:hypothetical protein
VKFIFFSSFFNILLLLYFQEILQSNEQHVEKVCEEFDDQGIICVINSSNEVSITCLHCFDKFKIKIQSLRLNPRYLVTSHVNSAPHKQKASDSQTKITQFFSIKAVNELSDFDNPLLAGLCLGYRPSLDYPDYALQFFAWRQCCFIFFG